ncbi:unnamed protein product [Paramecium sonneborni]|uniref:Protein kinase domain-containing protein n=1 Tax=Paramecium sonneborni TaxID=65129 RepID=A0A8S1KDI9_9CILI|nr:unnamed protein product [Paramecium sonneborni]
MQKQIKNYTIQQQIGRGANGVVYLAIKDEDKCEYAFKLLEDEISEKEQEIMEQISKYELNNIVRTYEKFNYQGDFIDYSCIIMDYCNNGDLASFLKQQRKNLKIDQIKDMIFQIAFGIWELQQFNIIHRDLKPQNILIHIEKNQHLVKICDLGLSKISKKNVMHTINIGTPCYMAPELIQSNESKNYDTSVDIWAFGVIIFDFFSEIQLFYGLKIKNIFEQILNPQIQEKLNLNIKDDNIKKICEKCLNINPLERPKIEQILVSLDSKKFKEKKQKFLNQKQNFGEISMESQVGQMETNHKQTLENPLESQNSQQIDEFTQEQNPKQKSQQIEIKPDNVNQQDQSFHIIQQNQIQNHHEQLLDLSNLSSHHKYIDILIQKKVRILTRIKDKQFANKLIQMFNQQKGQDEIFQELKNKADQLITNSNDCF